MRLDPQNAGKHAVESTHVEPPRHVIANERADTLLALHDGRLGEQVTGLGSQFAIDDFIESKIAVTYIVIDPMFKDCPFERDGWYGKFREAE